MKQLRRIAAFAAVLCAVSTVRAQVVIDALTVQGFMKRANGTAVSDGTYSLHFAVRQNGTTVWAKTASTVITSGLFSANLSGTGSDLSALPGSTGMNSNFTGVTLNPALLQASGNGGLVVRVYSSTAINGANPQFDITVNAVPTSYVSSVAQSVASGSVVVASLAASARTTTSAGAGDAGKLVLLNGSGKIDDTMIPDPLPAVDGSALTNISGANISSNSVTTTSIAASSKASTSAGAGDAGKMVLLNGSGKIDSSMVDGLTVAQGGTGASTLTSGSLIVGNGTGAVAELAGGSTGNLVYATGASVWASGTPDTAGVVDKASAQTISGVKTLSGGVIVKGSAPGNDNLGHYEAVTTCTPVPRGVTTAGTPTTSVALCRYTRIGKLVVVNINMTWSALTGSAGAMAIGGLPYAAANITNLNQACAITVGAMTSPANSTVTAYIQPNESMIRLFSQVVATNVQAALTVDTAASAQVSCSYMVD